MGEGEGAVDALGAEEDAEAAGEEAGEGAEAAVGEEEGEDGYSDEEPVGAEEAEEGEGEGATPAGSPSEA